MKVFVSYEETEGRAFAEIVASVFERNGHEIWFFGRNRSPGARSWEEISAKIDWAGRVLYLGTRSSLDSDGQTEEIGMALNQGKTIIPVRINGAELRLELSARNYERASTYDFESVCSKVAKGLAESETAATEVMKPAMVNLGDRYRYLSELRSQANGLRTERVTSGVDNTLRAYEGMTLPRQFSSMVQITGDVPSDFRRFGSAQRVRLSEFNAADYYWDGFAADLGRGAAFDEKHYLLSTMLAESIPPTGFVDAARGDFAGVRTAINDLRAAGHAPNVLIAPVQVMVPFARCFDTELEFVDRRERLRLGEGINIRVFWSSRQTPLDRFIIFNSRGGRWMLAPDLETGHALSVAIGRSKLFPDEVEWVAESIGKYTIDEPGAFRTVQLCTDRSEPPEN